MRRSRLEEAEVAEEEDGPGSDRTRRWRGWREGLRGGKESIRTIREEVAPSSSSSSSDEELDSDSSARACLSFLHDLLSAHEFLRVIVGFGEGEEIWFG